MFAVTTGLPVLERREDQLAGGLDAADHLDDDVDRRVLDDLGSVAGEQALRDRNGSLAREVAHRDASDRERQPGARLDRRRPLADEPDERAADVATAEDADADGLAHRTITVPGAIAAPGCFQPR